ncbi:MAG TPA: WhiB family transcriptional regulator, partial [Acidimicrobiia bacterium]|nr:WhiB family transcriptional regulator [Acidimicrobiia bacterium]
MDASTAWMGSAACIGFSGRMFPDPSDTSGIADAKLLCDMCPVRRECLDWAVATNQQHGIWG